MAWWRLCFQSKEGQGRMPRHKGSPGTELKAQAIDMRSHGSVEVTGAGPRRPGSVGGDSDQPRGCERLGPTSPGDSRRTHSHSEPRFPPYQTGVLTPASHRAMRPCETMLARSATSAAARPLLSLVSGELSRPVFGPSSLWASVSSSTKAEQQPIPPRVLGGMRSSSHVTVTHFGAQNMGDPRHRETRGSLTLSDTLGTRMRPGTERGTDVRRSSPWGPAGCPVFQFPSSRPPGGLGPQPQPHSRNHEALSNVPISSFSLFNLSIKWLSCPIY